MSRYLSFHCYSCKGSNIKKKEKTSDHIHDGWEWLIVIDHLIVIAWCFNIFYGCCHRLLLGGKASCDSSDERDSRECHCRKHRWHCGLRCCHAACDVRGFRWRLGSRAAHQFQGMARIRWRLQEPRVISYKKRTTNRILKKNITNKKQSNNNRNQRFCTM